MFSCSKADNSRKPVSGHNFFFLSFSTEPETCKALPAPLNRPGHATLQCQQCWGPTPARSIHSFPKSKTLGADCQEPRIREAGPHLGDKGTNTGNKIRSQRQHAHVLTTNAMPAHTDAHPSTHSEHEHAGRPPVSWIHRVTSPSLLSVQTWPHKTFPAFLIGKPLAWFSM